MMKNILAAGLCFSIFGVVASESPSTESRVLIGCLYHHADRFDDGISDANTIAQTVGEACHKEGRAAFAHKVSAEDLARDPYLQKAEAAAIHGLARTVVLKNRVETRR